ncbi:peptidase domain-containing ABC transporter [Alteromonas flava]|uniref:peptidase domain-containing ABC transporter n=1 Tax=Alteromonas flava TaxID=2048003 RepID=UPI000C28BA1C|nr:peptidase domain-containing ABC transporter [Alteromonas flava]
MTVAALDFSPWFSFRAKPKVPLVLQTEASECGLACLAMLAGTYGYQTDLTQLRHRFALSAHGATLRQVMDVASHLNFSSRALRLELEQLAALQTPCILHWNMNHFVVLVSVNSRKRLLTINDPACGEQQLTWQEADKHFTGIALELSPNQDFTPQKQRQQLTLQHFWSRIHGLKRSLVIILMLSLMLQLFAIASPFYMQIVIDDVIVSSNHQILTTLALGFGLLLVIEVGVSVLRQVSIIYLSNRLSLQMSSNVFQHLIRLPMDYFLKRHVGDIVSRFGSLRAIREMFTTGLITAIVDGLMAAVTLIVMFIYSVKLATVVIAIVMLYALVRYTFYRPIRRLNEEAIVAAANENSHFMESVRALQTVKLFAQENQRQNQWLNKLTNSMNKHIQISRWNISFASINQLLFGLENLLVIYLAALAVMDSVLSVGMLYAFISYKSRFINAMDSLITQWIDFKMLDLHFARLSDIVYTPKDPLLGALSPNHSGYTNSLKSIAQGSGALSVDDITYRHSQVEAPLFSRVSLRVEPGQTVAIIGASGCGKTTLMKCMMGLLAVQEGNVRIDEQPLQQSPDYRQRIAAVMQDDQLLQGSIADNIACFAEQVDMAKVVAVAQVACIHDDVMTMAMQYNTLVGDMGTTLSGGQKQRILLARALYRQPAILFLDEATSHLDLTNEQQVTANIANLKITRVLIAHRLQTLQQADVIYELINGELRQVEPNSLINKPT